MSATSASPLPCAVLDRILICSSYMPPANGLAMVVRAAIMFDDASSVLGLSARLWTDTAHYRLELNTTTVSIVRVNGNRVVLASVRQNGKCSCSCEACVSLTSRRCQNDSLATAAT